MCIEEPAEATLQTADAQESTTRFHPGGFPYCIGHHVELPHASMAAPAFMPTRRGIDSAVGTESRIVCVEGHIVFTASDPYT